MKPRIQLKEWEVILLLSAYPNILVAWGLVPAHKGLRYNARIGTKSPDGEQAYARVEETRIWVGRGDFIS